MNGSQITNRVVGLLFAIALEGCSENRVDIVNESDEVLDEVALSASWGEEIWRGSLRPAERKTICFPSRTDGSGVLEVTLSNGSKKRAEFDYMTKKLKTKNTLVIRENLEIDTEWEGGESLPYHWFCGVFPKPWEKTATGWQ